MTIKEYLERNHMKNTELARLVGCSPATITSILKYDTAVRNPEHFKKFKELGIETRAYDPNANKKKESGTGYLYYEKIQVAMVRRSDIYCYTLGKLNAVTQYLNGRRICYYVIPKDDYWVVKYDKTIKKEEWVQ